MIIGTGYYEKSEWQAQFASIWITNLLRHCPSAKQVFVVCAGSDFPVRSDHITAIRGTNLGHVGDYLDGKRSGKFCGWSASVLALAMIAYNAGEDLVYLEQDCLAFGPWLDQTYEDLGEGSFIFGKKHSSAPWMSSSQSLFIIRHSFLLTFISAYMHLPDDKEMLPEDKFTTIEGLFPDVCRRLSFGYDRERPINWKEPVFYIQQWTADELDEAKRMGLIC